MESRDISQPVGVFAPCCQCGVAQETPALEPARYGPSGPVLRLSRLREELRRRSCFGLIDESPVADRVAHGGKRPHIFSRVYIQAHYICYEPWSDPSEAGGFAESLSGRSCKRCQNLAKAHSGLPHQSELFRGVIVVHVTNIGAKRITPPDAAQIRSCSTPDATNFSRCDVRSLRSSCLQSFRVGINATPAFFIRVSMESSSTPAFGIVCTITSAPPFMAFISPSRV